MTKNTSKTRTLAIIGCGNMGRALVEGLAAKGEKIIACDNNQQKLSELEITGLDVQTTSELDRTCKTSDIIIIAVKPDAIPELLKEMSSNVQPGTHIVSVAAGVTCQTIKAGLGEEVFVSRVMPNLPALIGEGASAVYSNDADKASETQELFSAVGISVLVSKEADLNTVTGLSGSGPAFICVVIEALAESGVKLGLEKETALELALQTVLGTAKYLKQTKTDPTTLKQRVSSPGGTTVRGLEVLGNNALRNELIQAVEAATKRAEELASQQ